MDPNRTWASLKALWEEGDDEGAADMAVHLMRWLDKGGFMPRTVTLDPTEFGGGLALVVMYSGDPRPRWRAELEDFLAEVEG